MKAAKKNRKKVSKKFKEEYKEKIRIMDRDFKDLTREYNLLNNLDGTTSMNEIPTEYQELLIKDIEKSIKKEERKLNREKKKLNKIYKKLDITPENSTDSL